jgi:hypothetical protein
METLFFGVTTRPMACRREEKAVLEIVNFIGLLWCFFDCISLRSAVGAQICEAKLRQSVELASFFAKIVSFVQL